MRTRRAVSMLACAFAGLFAANHYGLFRQHSPSELDRIPDSELGSVKRRAEQGDKKSIERLVAHYLSWEGNEVAARDWAMRGAELGDTSMQKIVILILARSESPNDRQQLEQLTSRWKLPNPLQHRSEPPHSASDGGR